MRGLIPDCLSLYCQAVFTVGLLLTVGSNFASATLCYTPDGTISNDVPCNSTAEYSVCCTQGFLCTNNNLCQPAKWWHGTNGSNPQQFIRGTCTDKTWSSSACPENCVAESVDGGEWVMQCGKNSTNYCCSDENCCAKSSSNKFVMDEPLITATAGVTPETTTSSTTSATSSTTAISTPASSSSSSDESTDDSHSKTIGIGVGVGVGVGAGVVILGCLIAWWLIRRRRQSKSRALEASQMSPVYFKPAPNELDTQDPRMLSELHGGRNRAVYEME